MYVPELAYRDSMNSSTWNTLYVTSSPKFVYPVHILQLLWRRIEIGACSALTTINDGKISTTQYLKNWHEACMRAKTKTKSTVLHCGRSMRTDNISTAIDQRFTIINARLNKFSSVVAKILASGICAQKMTTCVQRRGAVSIHRGRAREPVGPPANIDRAVSSCQTFTAGRVHDASRRPRSISCHLFVGCIKLHTCTWVLFKNS